MVEPHVDRDRFVIGDASAHVGLLNCERIADRQHIHGWQVEPHFHEGLSQLFVFQTGGIEARVDYQIMRLTEPSAVWLPPLCNHGFHYPKDCVGWVLTLPSADAARIAAGHSWLQSWIAEPRILTGEESQRDVADCARIMQWIETEHHGYDETRNIALESLFNLLMIAFHRGLMASVEHAETTPDRRQSMLNRFHDLLDRHLHDIRSVADYADMLAVTPTHLSRSLKTLCGRTAGEIIHDRIILMAKRELVFTDKPLAQIAYDLNFSTPSYFTRFFVRQVGEPPRNFRDRLRERPKV